MVIYKLTNNTNKKVYIGQTKNFNNRMRGHKSTAYQENNSSYNLPIYRAIRKYGWNNFTKEIIEIIPEDKENDQNYIDERERYYIALYDSTNDEKGYNIALGGQKGANKKPLSFEEKCKISTIFSLEEMIDIQNMLMEGMPMKDIMEKYSPKLSHSLITNINIGLNFKNENLNYPLHDYLHDGHSLKFTREEQAQIQQDIIDGELTYQQIADKWGIYSVGLISLINNGKRWKRDDLEYPLSTRNHSRLQNFRTWVRPVQNDLMNSNLKLTEIAKKYNKAYSTIKKINSGSSYYNKEYKYPLTLNRKKV